MNGKHKVAFVGAGNMAEAIARGIISSGMIKPENIIASARTNTRLSTVWNAMGTLYSTKNSEVVKDANIIFLCVKPHILPGVLDELVAVSTEHWSNKVFISVAAGVTVEFIENKLMKIEKVKVIRTMPNTPCLVQSGVVVYSLGTNCSQKEGAMLESLMSVTGHVEEVEEEKIDAMASLMGCSIAWFYNIVEGISDGGVKNGVPREVSYRLISKAMEGAAKLSFESSEHIGRLKDDATSPHGSTICGIYELEQAGLRGIFMRAVEAATKRNKELGKQ